LIDKKEPSHFRTVVMLILLVNVSYWSGKVRVLTKFATDYQLVSLSERPVTLAERTIPFFSEDFKMLLTNLI
jgi:hypothetical protein